MINKPPDHFGLYAKRRDNSGLKGSHAYLSSQQVLKSQDGNRRPPPTELEKQNKVYTGASAPPVALDTHFQVENTELRNMYT